MVRPRVLAIGIIAVLTACGTHDVFIDTDDVFIDTYGLVLIDQLPATADETTMVAEVSEDGVKLRIVDLKSSTSRLVEVDRQRFSPIAAGLDSVWYVDGDGAVRSVDWLAVPTDAPPFVPAEGQRVLELVALGATGRVAVGLTGDSPGVKKVVVLDANGSVRCSGNFDPSSKPTEFGVELWAFGSESSPRTSMCAEPLGELGLREMAQSTGFTFPTEFLYADGALTGFGPGRESVVQFRRQADGSWSESASTEIGAFGNGLELAAGSVWATAGPRVVRMSAVDLSVEAELTVFECGDGATPLAADGMVWVDDDCDGILIRIDPSTNDIDQWVLPTDGVSDIQTNIRISPGGLWYTDYEQSAEPYFFSFERERFERLPDALRQPELFVHDYELRPVLSPPS